MLKTFSGPGYLRSEDVVVWLWHLLVNLYIWLTISSWYGSIPLTLRLIGRDGGLNTLCHSCGFASQHRVLKTFHGSGYLCSEDVVVWLWHLLVNFYIYLLLSEFTQTPVMPIGYKYWQLCGSGLNAWLKGIVKWAEPCKCVILLVSRILWHKRINSFLKEWRFWYLILIGDFPP